MDILNHVKRSVVDRMSIDRPMPFGWPPDCCGFFYQPERPVAGNTAKQDEEDINKKALE